MPLSRSRPGPRARPPSGAAAPGSDPGALARDLVLRRLAMRPHTTAELQSVLRRRGVPADVTEEVLAHYSDVGLLDDAAFAQAWVTSRRAGRGLGSRRLQAELRRRGVGADEIDAALAEVTPDSEQASAREIVRRRLRTSTQPSRSADGAAERPGVDVRQRRRLVDHLVRRGYSPAQAAAAVAQELAEHEADDLPEQLPELLPDELPDEPYADA